MTSLNGNLSDWLEQRYLAWRSQQDRNNDSVSAFARYLHVSQSLVDAFMNGRRSSMSQATADRIADKLGDEIYDLVGLPRPDPVQRRLEGILYSLSEDSKKKLMDYAERLYRTNQANVGRAEPDKPPKVASIR